MIQIKELAKQLRTKHDHFIFVNWVFYKKWKYLIKFLIFINPNYLNCTIFRKQHKMHKKIVVVGLKWNGKNVKRRTSGLAKEFLSEVKNPRCIFCEKKLNTINATTDHIIPISKGGNNSQVNLITCCLDCNSERGNIEFYKYLKLKNKKYSKLKTIFI